MSKNAVTETSEGFTVTEDLLNYIKVSKDSRVECARRIVESPSEVRVGFIYLSLQWIIWQNADKIRSLLKLALNTIKKHYLDSFHIEPEKLKNIAISAIYLRLKDIAILIECTESLRLEFISTVLQILRNEGGAMSQTLQNSLCTALEDEAIREMVQYLGDQYSRYKLPEKAQPNKASPDLHVGIGLSLQRRDGEIVIRTVQKSSPAARAGIAAGDILVSIEGCAAQARGFSATISLMTDPDINCLTLRVIRDGRLLDMTIMKEDPWETVHLKQDGDIALVKIDSFKSETGKEFRECLEQILKLKKSRLCIDLRNNRGGLVASAYEVVSLFLREQINVDYVDNTTSDRVRIEASQLVDLPLVILVNESTFSAAEIVSALLQYYGYAVIVGRETGGKRLCQTPYELGNGGKLLLTDRRWFLPNEPSVPLKPMREPIAKLGAKVIPNVVVGPAQFSDDIELRIALEILREDKYFVTDKRTS